MQVIWVKQQEFSFCLLPLILDQQTLDIVSLSHCDAKGTETNIFKILVKLDGKIVFNEVTFY